MRRTGAPNCESAPVHSFLPPSSKSWCSTSWKSASSRVPSKATAESTQILSSRAHAARTICMRLASLVTTRTISGVTNGRRAQQLDDRRSIDRHHPEHRHPGRPGAQAAEELRRVDGRRVVDEHEDALVRGPVLTEIEERREDEIHHSAPLRKGWQDGRPTDRSDVAPTRHRRHRDKITCRQGRAASDCCRQASCVPRRARSWPGPLGGSQDLR